MNTPILTMIDIQIQLLIQLGMQATTILVSHSIKELFEGEILATLNENSPKHINVEMDIEGLTYRGCEVNIEAVPEPIVGMERAMMAATSSYATLSPITVVGYLPETLQAEAEA